MSSFFIINAIFFTLLAGICFLSVKWGTICTVCAYLFIPTIIANASVLGTPLSVINFCELILFIQLRQNVELREVLSSFYTKYQKVIWLYVLFCIMQMLIADIPFNDQFGRYFMREMFYVLLALITYVCSLGIPSFIKSFVLSLFFVLTVSVLFSIIFELVLGFNPAGAPLFAFLGLNNEYLVDMIDSSRAGMSFRMQSIFGHPLSLGQYYLLILPFLFYKAKESWYSVALICVLSFCILLSGSRGAVFPMIVIFLWQYASKISFGFITKSLFAVLLFPLCMSFFPRNIQRNVNSYANIAYTYVFFWDDNLQRKNEVSGSSMEMRFDQFKAAQRKIENSPIMGRGRGYREFAQDKYGGLDPNLLGYESSLLLVLVEQGYFGLIIYFLTLLYILKKNYINSLNHKYIAMTFFCYFVSTIMTGIRPLSLLLLLVFTIILMNDEFENERLERLEE